MANYNRIDFPVDIQRKTVGVTERGFGTILIFDTEKNRDFAYITRDELTSLEENSKAHKIASRLFMQKPGPQEVAIIGKAGEGTILKHFQEVIEEAGSRFFWLVCTDNSVEAVKTLAGQAQAHNKLYAVTMNNEQDVLAVLNEESDNAYVLYHNDPDAYVAEGMAVIMSFKVGGKTAYGKSVQGVKECNLTTTLEKTLEQKGCGTYVDKMGVLSVTGAKVLSGEWLDVVLGEYWIRWRMEEALQRLIFTEDKIPYSNRGISMLVAKVNGVLEMAVRQGIVIMNQYSVSTLDRRKVPSNDVANRQYDYVYWEATLSGAIHGGRINGVLTYDMINGGDE